MPLFRKKPVIIEAVRLTQPVEIETLEGKMRGEAGDWLITGVKGEQYPCKDEIFQATYEPVRQADIREDSSEPTAKGADYFCLGCRKFMMEPDVDKSVFPAVHRDCGWEVVANVKLDVGEDAVRAGES